MHCTTINNNRPITIQQPTKPNSSPTIAKIKSVCGSEIKFPFFTDVVVLLFSPLPVSCPEPEYAFADNRAEMADLAVQQY